MTPPTTEREMTCWALKQYHRVCATRALTWLIVGIVLGFGLGFFAAAAQRALLVTTNQPLGIGPLFGR